MSKEKLSQAQSFNLEINATMAENTSNVEVQLGKKMSCNIMFMAHCFKSIMNQDSDIKEAIFVALLEEMGEELKNSNEDKSKAYQDLLSKFKYEA